MIEGPKAKKAFGQHFLSDKQILEAIIEKAGIEKDDIVLEIGPGKGVLTQKLAKAAAKVIAVDVDSDMIEYSQNALREFDNVEMILADITSVNLEDVLSSEILDHKIKVVANIPYYITTPILEWLLKNNERFKFALLMVQFEVASKLTAKPATSNYSAITVKMNYCAEANFCFKVPKEAFVPSPRVDSAVVSFDFKENTPRKKELFSLIDEAFKLRRKNIKNSFKAGTIFASDMQKIDDILGICNIDSRKRAEELALNDYLNILEALNKN